MDTERQSQKQCGGCGGCEWSGNERGTGCMHGQRHWAHVIIKICVALIIFWCGVQFGELKAVLHRGYPSPYWMMGDYGRNQFYYTTDGGMMGNGWPSSAVSVPVESVPVPGIPTVKK